MQETNKKIPVDLKQALPHRHKNKRWTIYTFFKFGSIFQWTLVTLLVVTLPLVLTLLYSVWSIQRYTYQGEQLLQTIHKADNSKRLVDEISDMDQLIKKYQIFEDQDPKMFSVYEEHHKAFIDISKQTYLDPPPKKFKQPFTLLKKREQDLYDYYKEKTSDGEKLSKDDIKGYKTLRLGIKDLVKYGDEQIDAQTTSLSALAKQVERRVSLAAWFSVVLALMLGPVLLYLMNRPMKRIERAISKLGNEQFNKRIIVEGPSDLRKIGEHLEWLRQKLNQLENNKQFFIKTISHELKTPLASLVEGADLLQDEVVGELNDEQHKIIELLQIANISLSDLIENLLEYQKATSILSSMTPFMFNINDLIENICSDYQLLLDKKKISIEIEGKRIDLVADRDKIKTIISNLFSNALKFSPDGGLINIKLDVVGDHLNMLIADQGPGIEKDQLPYIFTEFYQQETPEDWKVKGSGLGLSLVKAYVGVHHGKIKILASNARYCGANFLIILPLASKQTRNK